MLGFAEGDSKSEKPRILMAKAHEQVIHFLFKLYTFPPSGDYVPPPEKADWSWFRAQKLAGASWKSPFVSQLQACLKENHLKLVLRAHGPGW